MTHPSQYAAPHNLDMLTIRIVGDYDPANATHLASTTALQDAARTLGLGVEIAWLPTVAIDSMDEPALREADALLIAPGSPYRSMEGALLAISHARLNDIPLLGTCGGFQHLIVEFARNVLGVRDAEHAESSPQAPTLVIVPLTCSLFGQRMEVEIHPGTLASAAYTRPRTTERYYCNFGLSPDYVEALVGAGLVISGVDGDGEVRIVEHRALRFFVGTLFVPQTSSTRDDPHPLVVALVSAAASARRDDSGANAANASIAGTTGR
jgi:CTP synthase (UTP-ammonia lyase)